MFARTIPLVLATLTLLPAAARADVTSDLIALYSFSGNTQDISGYANHGAPVGGFTYAMDRFGVQNAAGEFNGVNSFVQIPHSASLGLPDTAITQAAWVHLYGASLVGQAFGPVTMKSVSSENAFMYRLIASPGGISSAFNDWNNSAGTAQPIPIGEWHHVATVLDGSSLRVYYDGARIDSIPFSTSILPDTRDLTIGGDVPGILEIFYGRLDDVRIYARALSDDDIAELVGEVVGVESPAARLGLVVGPVRPNPTSLHSHVDFRLPQDGLLDLWVQDVRGRRVRTLRSGFAAAGAHSADWDGRDDHGREVAAGLYFFRLRAAGEESSTRVVRLP